MKKVMMIAALAAALVSCQSKGTQNNDAVAMDESVMAVTGVCRSRIRRNPSRRRRSGHPVCIERRQCRSRRRKRLHAGNNLSGCRRPRKEQELYFQRKERSYPERRRQQEENSHQADPERRGHSGVLRSSERHNPAPCQRQPAGSCE